MAFPSLSRMTSPSVRPSRRMSCLRALWGEGAGCCCIAFTNTPLFIPGVVPMRQTGPVEVLYGLCLRILTDVEDALNDANMDRSSILNHMLVDEDYHCVFHVTTEVRQCTGESTCFRGAPDSQSP